MQYMYIVFSFFFFFQKECSKQSVNLILKVKDKEYYLFPNVEFQFCLSFSYVWSWKTWNKRSFPKSDIDKKQKHF